MSDTPQLNYAPPPPMHYRRSFRRWVYGVVLLGLVVSGWWWVPPAWRRAELLYWQHQCLGYAPAADQVAYEEDYAIKPGPAVPTPWSKFYYLYSWPGALSTGTLFVHRMQKPDGEVRLVALDIVDYLGQKYTDARVFVPGNLFANPMEFDNPVPYFPADKSKVFAGRIDPTDPTHFTVKTLEDGREQTYDGWLQNDERIVFGERHSK
jgi:hypothetical protein